MTLLIDPTRQFSPAANERGCLRPVAVASGWEKEAFFAHFGVLVKKTAFFAKKQARSSFGISNFPVLLTRSATFLARSRALLARLLTFLIRSEALLTRSVSFLIRSKALLTRSVTFLTRSRALLTRLLTFLIRSEALLTRSVSFLIRSKALLTRSVTFLIRSKALLIGSVADLTVLKPENRVRMAQNSCLLVDTITAKTPRMNFIKEPVAAEVARLKAMKVRGPLRRLLHSLINFNVPVLKSWIQRVVCTDNNSAAWRSLRLCG